MAPDHTLEGLRVVELAGLAPGPFLGLLLATYGASVVRIDRPAASAASRVSTDLLTANKVGSLPLDLKNPSSRSVLHTLLSTSDILIDPFRPGVLEKLGLGAQDLLSRYPRLIVVRLTGFRRDGKWRDRAGHDINYLAVSGVLSLLGGPPSTEPPTPPGNLLADFAAGGMNAFVGVLLALFKRSTTNAGSVVNANMVDGSAFLATFPRLLRHTPIWDGPRGTNVLDGGCPYYRCYECKDAGRFVAVGALEPQFFRELLAGLELTESDLFGGFDGAPDGAPDRSDKTRWPHMHAVLERRFRTRTRDEWERVFESRDACVTPVKELGELEAEGWVNRVPVALEAEPEPEQQQQQNEQNEQADNGGWTSEGMLVGENAETVLRDWLGWAKGTDWIEEQGAVLAAAVRGSRSKL